MYFSVLVKLSISKDKTQLPDIPFFLPCIRSRRKIWKKVEEGSLARSFFCTTLFQFAQGLMQEQLLPFLLPVRQSHILLRDAIFKEQLTCIVQRNFLNKVQKVFAISFAYRAGKQNPMILQSETFCEPIWHVSQKTVPKCLVESFSHQGRSINNVCLLYKHVISDIPRPDKC